MPSFSPGPAEYSATAAATPSLTTASLKASSRDSGTKLSASPIASASGPEIRAPVRPIQRPTPSDGPRPSSETRGRNHEAPMSGKNPIAVSGMHITVVSVTMRCEPCTEMPMPPPIV